MKRWVLILVIPVLMAVVYWGILQTTDPSMHDEVKRYASILVVGCFVLEAVVRVFLSGRAK